MNENVANRNVQARQMPLVVELNKVTSASTRMNHVYTTLELFCRYLNI